MCVLTAIIFNCSLAYTQSYKLVYYIYVCVLTSIIFNCNCAYAQSRSYKLVYYIWVCVHAIYV